jgi:formylglycine-generating enzyme required for sulfatase activity
MPKRIRYTGLPAGQPIPFLLIRRKAPADPATFYVMQDKLTNGQFLAALDHPRMREILDRWRKSCPGAVRDPAVIRKVLAAAPPDHPAFNVTALEAHCFAELLGGMLPSAQQWNRAGGHPEQESPCEPGLVVKPGRGATPVGANPRDVSKFGCRGMAANGREFTRTVFLNHDLQFPPRPGNARKMELILKGVGFEADEPFKFGDQPAALDYGEPMNDVGLRVVVEP